MGRSNHQNRRLAAVMFTDMVGFSTLTHRDELLSLELLREHRAIVRPLLQAFHGREVSTTGDGFVVEFGSTEDAVRCALEIQKAFANRNAKGPEGRRIELRIGIHVGDVLGFDDDIYGDGVNIASRLQSLAPAGGICVSQAVYEQIQPHLNCPIHSMGIRRLKGFKKAVPVYSVDLRSPSLWKRLSRKLSHRPRLKTALASGLAVLAMASLWSRTPGSGLVERLQPDPRRLAVMPFDSEGIPEGQAYLSDGLTGAVISGLSRKGVHVLAKDSVMQVRKERMTPEEVGRKLRIGTMVTGMMVREGDRLRVTVSLVDTETQEVSWSGEFGGKTGDLFEIQNKIVSEIAGQFQGRGIASVPSNPAEEAPPAKEAYLAYLKGTFFLGKRTKDGLTKGISELQKAVKMDPRFAKAYAALANSAGLESYYGMISPVDASLKVVQYATQALALDPRSSDALMSLGEEQAYTQYDFQRAEKTFQLAIADDPGNATAHQWYGEFLAYTGRFHEALHQADQAVNEDPLSLVTRVAKGVMLYYARDYDRAIRDFQDVREMDPGFMLTYYWMGRAFVQKRDYAAAIAALKRADELSGHEPMMSAALGYAYAASGQAGRARKVYRELTEQARSRYVSPYHLALLEAGLGSRADAFRLLRRAVIERDSQTVMMRTDPELDPLREDPDFGRILAQIKPRAL